MSVIGDIRYGREIGRLNRPASNMKFIWYACPNCGYERWVRYSYIQHNLRSGKCKKCSVLSAENNPSWKGGKFADKKYGYIHVLLQPDDFFFAMADKNTHYVLEHRLVMAKHLGRCLQKWEIVHHKNHIKDDNRIENLKIVARGSHFTMHSKGYRDGYNQGLFDGSNEQINQLKMRISSLEDRVLLIEAENVLLRGVKSNESS
jgi:predicted RNA-binding Zn-ribbon protein involved in translation (DUF1610 family)